LTAYMCTPSRQGIRRMLRCVNARMMYFRSFLKARGQSSQRRFHFALKRKESLLSLKRRRIDRRPREAEPGKESRRLGHGRSYPVIRGGNRNGIQIRENGGFEKFQPVFFWTSIGGSEVMRERRRRSDHWYGRRNGHERARGEERVARLCLEPDRNITSETSCRGRGSLLSVSGLKLVNDAEDFPINRPSQRPPFKTCAWVGEESSSTPRRREAG